MDLKDLFEKVDVMTKANKSSARALKKVTRPTVVVNEEDVPEHVANHFKAAQYGVPQRITYSRQGWLVSHSVFNKEVAACRLG